MAGPSLDERFRRADCQEDVCPGITRLRRDDARMLGNGWCTRPSELDCDYETIRESCDFFTTGHPFRPTMQAQHDDAAAKNQPSGSSCSPNCSPT